MKIVKFLRASGFKEHVRTAACEFKSIRCIVFVKTVANITNRGKVPSNYHLLFLLSDLILQSYATIPDPTDKILVTLLPPSHSHSPDFGSVGAQRLMFLGRFLV